MSHNQSRAERSESTQYKKTGRSGSFNQRQFSGSVPTKGGGGASSAAPNPSSRSFKKNNNNAPVGQPGARSTVVDSSNSPAPHAVQNGAHQQQPPTYRVSGTPTISTSSDVKPTDTSTHSISRAVPRAPASNVSSAPAPSNISTTSSESKPPTTPGKAPGDASKPVPLQFGSISPGFMNGVQIPARTSSAPPNLDEQKKDQARHESLRAAVAKPVPSIPNQQFPKKDAGILDQPKAGETQLVSKPKRDAQISSATHHQSPSRHPIPGMPMQLPYHQAQVPVQFGGQNLQIQPQAMPGPPMQMPMPMSLPIGNIPVQHPMYVPGLQPHHMQPQGMMHQGQSLTFPPQMGAQHPSQLGSMGMSLPPQFQQQPAVKYGGTRKTVKITHPDTHEELRLESSPAPRLHPNISMQFYPGSYNPASGYLPAGSSVHLNSTQVPPTSQPPRVNQVTVKPPVGSRGEKELLPPTGSLSAGKTESSKPSRSGEGSVFPLKEIEPSSLSTSPKPKPGLGTSYATVASSSPVVVDRVVSRTSVSASDPMDGSASASTTAAEEVRSAVVMPDSIKDEHKKSGNDQQDQVEMPQTSLSSLPQIPEPEAVEVKSISSRNNLVSENVEGPSSTTAAAFSEASNSTSEGAGEGRTAENLRSVGMEVVNSRQSKPDTIGSLETSLKSLSLESPKITGKMVESSDHELTSTTGVLSEHTPDESEESLGCCSNDAKMDGNLAVPTLTSGGQNTKSSDASLSVPDSLETSLRSVSVETTVAKYDQVDQKSAPVLVSYPPEDVLPSTVNGKVVSDVNVGKTVAQRGKKKKKELFKKAEAAGASSDLYMAYKGPEENKETVMSSQGSDNSSSVSEKEKTMPCEKPAQIKVEPDDWEDAAEISTPQLETSKNEIHDKDADGYELTIKRYSRDFLLKFVELCTNLPEEFEIASDIADALMVSSVNVPRESYPSPGRNTDRPVGGSRPDRRASGLVDEDKWNKFPAHIMSGRGDMRTDVNYMHNIVGVRPVQGVNHAVLRSPRPQPSVYYGGILTGPMQLGPQGGQLQRNNSESDRWLRGTGFQKGFMPNYQTPMQVIHKAEKKYEIGKVTDEEQAKQRQLKGILNKLTPQNFEKLFEQVKQVNIDNVITLSGVISQIFDKALMEPTFCEMYANFCFHLAADLPDLSVDNEKITFKRLLLNKCQEEFERGEREEEEANKAEEEGEVKQTAEEREEKRLQVRRRMLGNIRLIGELYKKRMLTERIMHECINKLLGQYHNPDEENIEALCKLMSTIGEMIDHPKAKEFMDAYFDIMAQLSNNMKLSSRVRFMLKDSIDLRKNKWQQRRKVEGPKKIDEVHRDAAQERHAQASRLARVPSMGNSARRGPPPMEYATRSSNMLSPPSPQIGGFRGVPPQPRGYGSQDARTDERHSSENRTMSVPMPQRPPGDETITLGPQGGLARGMAFRGYPSAPSSIPFVEIPSSGDARRVGPGQNSFSSMSERTAYGPEVIVAAPIYDQSHPQERNATYVNREVRNMDHSSDRALPVSPHARGGPPTSTQNASSDMVWTDELQAKSLATIKEFYSARDEHEVALCMKEFDTPSFYPSMISAWVNDSFERKDMERDLLTKLLINLTKPGQGMITESQLIKGFGSVLAGLEDMVNDAPKAAEFLGRIFAKVILEKIVSLSEIGQLIYEGGEEQGQLVQIGLAGDVLGSVLDIIQSEKGESVLNEIRSSSNLRLEDFRPPPGSKKSPKIDKFI